MRKSIYHSPEVEEHVFTMETSFLTGSTESFDLGNPFANDFTDDIFDIF